jgi:hypothetical protein
MKHDIQQFVYDYPYVSSTPPTVEIPPSWAYWKFEEENGNRIDATGNGHDFVPFIYEGLGDPSRVIGKLDYGIRCDYIETYPGNEALLGSSGWEPGIIGSSLSLWIKAHATTFTTMEVLYIYGTITVEFTYDNISKYKLVVTGYIETDYIYDQDTWYFIVVTKDNNGVYLYVNNVLAGTYLYDMSLNPLVNPGILFIASGFDSGCYGFVDEYGIWDNVVLTESQRDKLYNNGNGWSPY